MVRLLTRDLELELPFMRGFDVLDMQRGLFQKAGSTAGMPDGVFGPVTDKAVRAWQSSKGLKSDGVVGKDTWASLFPEAAKTAELVLHLPPRDATGADMPLTRPQMLQVKHWMLANFGPQIEASIAGSPIDADLVYAIAGKESAIYWVGKIASLSAAELMPLCVFDASGDFPNTERSAFPINAAALRADPRFGDLTDMLITEANKSRQILRGFGPANFLYKGYGIFQYDLQNIKDDEAFFRDRLWHRFDMCIDRFMKEIHTKLAATNNLHDAIRAYNGSGQKAEQYAAQVMLMRTWCADQTETA